MKKVIIDCDPGHDDMVAIMVAVASPELELLGVTTVAGNQTGEKTALNARRVLTLIGHTEIPVARGADQPLVRPLHVAEEIHGESGLDGADLPEAAVELQREGAIDFLRRRIREQEEQVTLIPLGPLTNIALLLAVEPEIAGRIERIVLMGGAIADANVTPAAEFNMYVDPEAAARVFSAGVPITMVGLDVTKRTRLTLDDLERLQAGNGRVSGVVSALLRFFAESYRRRFGFAAAPLHDALAVMSVIDPAIVSTKHVNVSVECGSELTRGRTVVDLHGTTGRAPNAEVAFDVDVARFRELFFTTMETLDRT